MNGYLLLVSRRGLRQAPEPMKADGAGQGVSHLAFVQLRGCLPAQFRIFPLVEHERGALDAADFAQRQRLAFLTRIGTQALQHQRRGIRSGADRGGGSRRTSSNVR